MKIFNSSILTLFLFLFVLSNVNCQTETIDLDNTQLSILTCRSGDELYSTFGHTAIRINNPTNGVDFVYNYGLFSFNTPYFYIKFMRGQLPYFLGATKMKRFLRDYDYEKRSVFEQKLILDNDQKEKMLGFLIENSKKENRYYKYDFFHDNCATRVVDVYSLAGDVSYDYEVQKRTFRDLLKENLQNLVWSDFGIDLVIGARADVLTNRRNQMFLPEYVMANLASAKVNGKNMLAEDSTLILDHEELNAKRKSRSINWPLILTCLVFIITIAFNFIFTQKAKIYNKVFLGICAALGLFLLFMWFGTNHGATRDNWNILWLNPIILVFLFAKGNVKRIAGYTLLLVLVVSALNCIITFLPQFFNVAFLPWILAIALIIYSILNKKKEVSV